ncbi:YJL163C [Zygosaccharomyces parabailii]|nr:YJL163C [Zygosaccharomyces parabailii]CDH16476.1 uncharacterized protein ZBAI_08264 [Zygosaccharomyces bailii ISA1307]
MQNTADQEESSALLGKAKQPAVIQTESVCETMDEDEMDDHRWRQEVHQLHKHTGFLGRPSMGILSVLLALMTLGEMLCWTPMISLLMKKVCVSDICDPVKVQETMSSVSSSTMVLSGLLGMSLAGPWGQLSDRMGRVRVFGYMTLIRFVGHGLHLISLSPWCFYSKTFIVCTGSIGSLSGGMFSLLANTYSYIADITEPQHRTAAMGVLMSVMYATMGLGPIFGSLLVKIPYIGGDNLPVYCALSVDLVAATLSLLAMHEPRHEQARRNSCDSCASGKSSALGPLKQLWRPLTRSGSTEPRHTVVLLLVLDVIFLCITAGSGPATLLFASYRYQWRSEQLGYFLSATGMGRACVLLLIAPHMLRLLRSRYGTRPKVLDKVDVLCIRFSLCTLLAGLALLFYRNEHESTMYVYAALQAPTALCSPTIQATVIKYCKKTETGQCFGGMALLRSAVMLVFPALLLRVYGWTVSTQPELFLAVPLACASLAVLISFFLQARNTAPLDGQPSALANGQPDALVYGPTNDGSLVSDTPSQTAESARDVALAQAETLRENCAQA